MTTELIVIRVQVLPEDAEGIRKYFEEASRLARPVDGFLGGRLFRSVDQPTEHLILWHYRDVQAADAGLREVAKGKALPQRQTTGSAPADVTRGKVVSHYNTGSDGLPIGPFLSLSVRVAEPGYGKDLAWELERILGELAVIPGFGGSLVAANDTLDEEILGFATWTSREAFQTSIPAGTFYVVKLYEQL